MAGDVVIGMICSLPSEIEIANEYSISWSIKDNHSTMCINGCSIFTPSLGNLPEFSFIAQPEICYTIVVSFSSSNVEHRLTLEPRNFQKEHEEETHDDIDRWFANRWNYWESELGDDTLSAME
jgi:hypothetical protein